MTCPHPAQLPEELLALLFFRTPLLFLIMSSEQKEVYELALKFKFGKPYWADYARQAINADPEPRPKDIKRTMTAQEDGTLLVTFASTNLKLVRTACSAMMEYLSLTAEVFSRFDPELNPSLYTM